MSYSGNFAPANSSQPISNLNGRIDLVSAIPTLQIPQFQTKVDNTNFAKEAMGGQFTSTKLSDVFFSVCNINALQEGIRYRIYVETNGKHIIGRQSDNELKIVMRSIYLQNAKNDSRPVVEQVRELNALVLQWAVPEVLSNLLQYEVYRRDASSLPVPLERAQLATSKGTKTLEIKSFM